MLRVIWIFGKPKAIYSAPTHDAPEVQSGVSSTPDLRWYHVSIPGKSNRHGVMENLPLSLTGVLVYEMIPQERLGLSSMAVRDYEEHQTLAQVDAKG